MYHHSLERVVPQLGDDLGGIPLDIMASGTTQFSSDGFDLGASGGAEDVVYEIGGGVTTTAANDETHKDGDDDDESKSKDIAGPTDESERIKALGNEEFKLGNYLDAYDYYTEAIDACPSGEGVGPTGRELLELREQFEEKNRERMMERQRIEVERRRTRRYNSTSNEDDKKEDDDEEGGGDDEDGGKPIEFAPPRHVYGHKLAVYHANRAATCLHLGREEEAVEDCDVSIMFNPTYAKAYLRRCTANERLDNTEGALSDAKKALQFDPNNSSIRRTVARLEKLEKERLEKLKEETMGKLKDLGNSLLGNFGLSLDNFSAVQDPNTGGYSISFDQNKK